MQALKQGAGKATKKEKSEQTGRVLYLPVIEKISPLIRRTDVRLRFINNVTGYADTYQRDLERSLHRFPRLKKTGLYRWLLSLSVHQGVNEASARETGLSDEERAGLKKVSTLSWFHRQVLSITRRERVLYFSSIAVLVMALGGLFSLVFFATYRVNAYRERNNVRRQLVAGADTPKLPSLPESQQVWLVDKKDGYERYSNGLRVVTSYETSSRPRQFQMISHGMDQVLPTVQTAPMGIVFHSSESQLVPFEPGNNTSITNISTYLLEYVRKNRSYNYLIDRFGQVYRIVPDSQVANHAGRSVWGDDRGLFIELNESFIGVCFETRSVDTGKDTLTEAQVISGRQLTGALRSLYQIPDADCTSHGLVSVNPDNMLIAYHSDWITGFPYDAMGLTDKGKVPPPSLAELGFSYDGGTLERLGGVLTPGMTEAVQKFNQLAAASGLSTEDFRRKLREQYLQQQERIRAGHADTVLPEKTG
jgi:hypothetical protein